MFKRNASKGKGGSADAKGSRRKERDSDMGEKQVRLAEKIGDIDFRDIVLLRRFVTQQGKIVPCRLTGASAKQQREIAKAINRARVMGMMP